MPDTEIEPYENFQKRYWKQKILPSDLAGGSGNRIWQCVDKVTKKQHSMKKIPKTKCSLNKLLEEVAILKECNGHPNLLDVHHVYQSEDHYYIVMDNLDHPNLTQMLSKHQAFGPKQVGKVARILLNALVYLHDPQNKAKMCGKEIVHGNINAKTILIPKGKSIDQLLLVDFSRAHRNDNLTTTMDEIDTSDSDDSEDGSTTSSRRRIRKRTQFHAPEFNETGPTAKTDLWALGILVYLLLTGHYPFRRASDTLEGVKEWHGIRSKKIQGFIRALLSYYPEQRPSAAKMNELSNWQETDYEELEGDLKKVMQGLASINKEYELKMAVRSFIFANFSSESSKERLGQIFQLVDTKNNNFLSKKEFEDAMVHAGIVVEWDAIEHLFDKVDMNGNKGIGYNEFMAFAEKEEILFERKKLKAAFDAFDWSNTGYITAEDLKSFSASAGGSAAFRQEKVLRTKQIQAIMEQADTNGDGKISFDEFADMMLKKARGGNQLDLVW